MRNSQLTAALSVLGVLVAPGVMAQPSQAEAQPSQAEAQPSQAEAQPSQAEAQPVPPEAPQRKTSLEPEVAEAKPDGGPFQSDPIADGAIIVVSLGSVGVLELISSTGEIRPQQIAPGFDRHRLIAIDRAALTATPSRSATRASNIGLGITALFALVDPVLSGFREHLFGDRGHYLGADRRRQDGGAAPAAARLHRS
jgi:hypothetical protein